ncbi:MAG: thioesterase family protein [Saprospiraceae bacterium]
MELIYTKNIIIEDEHLDSLNHVNNVQYIKWMEEMAKEHWDLLKVNTEYAEDYWVLVDHHIQYLRQVFKGEVLLVRTYPEEPEGIRQPRKVEFYIGNDLVVDSRTKWVLIDKNTNKIKRLPKDWLNSLL